MSEPEMKKIRARDVVPYFWAQWCSIAGGEPFANTIVNIRWTEDGTQLSFMLGTHNFFFADPDEELELVPKEPHEYHRTKPPFVLPPRPTPKPTPEATPEAMNDCPCCGAHQESTIALRALLAARDAELAELKRDMHDGAAKYFADRAAWRERAEKAESERDALKAELEAVRRELHAGLDELAEVKRKLERAERHKATQLEVIRQRRQQVRRLEAAQPTWVNLIGVRDENAALKTELEAVRQQGCEDDCGVTLGQILDFDHGKTEGPGTWFCAHCRERVAEKWTAAEAARREAEERARLSEQRAQGAGTAALGMQMECATATMAAERAREVVRQCKDALDFLFTPGPGIAVPEKYEHEHEVAHVAWNRKLERLEDARSAATTLLGEGA